VAEAGADVLAAIGGVDLEAAWARLGAVDEMARGELARAAVAEARNHEAGGRSRLTILRTIGEVHRALRNDRSLRRLQLAQVGAARLTTVLPVWVGSLADVDELLPVRPGLFDLVVVEEATTITPAMAAPALLRGQRLVLFADPAARLTRHPSVFEVAVAHTPAIGLDDQFRGSPEIDDGALAALGGARSSRPPRLDRLDRVEVLRVTDAAAGAEAVLDILGRARAAPVRSVGVVTTSRLRAAELEHRVLDMFCADDVESLDLCLGAIDDVEATRDLVIADLTGGAPDGEPTAPRVLALVSRARERLVLVHDDGAFARAVLAAVGAGASSDAAPLAVLERTTSGGGDAWATAVLTVLDEAGFAPRPATRSGRHVIDVAVIRPVGPTAVLTTIHPDGVDAHIDRHLELARAGWRVLEVFPSRWAERLEKLPDHIDNRWGG
jgi:hypothetical protein